MTCDFVSIIVPVFNEEKDLEKCLESLRDQKYPKDRYEIIVVDNGSTDRSVDIAHRYTNKVYERRGVKVGGVRNYGAEKANGSIFAFIDGDCVAGPYWISKAVEALQSEKVGAVGGGCLLRSSPSWVELGWKFDATAETKKVGALAGGSFIIKKSVFFEFDGFDEFINAGEDTKLSRSIGDAGLELWFISECFVIHYGYPTTISGFLKREIWHSSSYLRSNYGLKDRTFVSVILFTFSFFFFIAWCFFGGWVTLALSSFLILSPCAFLAKRLFVDKESLGMGMVTIYAISVIFLYYVGRSYGMLIGLISDPYEH